MCEKFEVNWPELEKYQSFSSNVSVWCEGTDVTQLLWLEMGLFSKKALHNIKNIHNSAKTYGILLK